LALSLQNCHDPAGLRDSPDSRLVFSVIETRPRHSFFVFFAGFLPRDLLGAHLADLLSADRRCGDGIKIAISAKKGGPQAASWFTMFAP
jgi:hypothetical protein